MPFFSNELYPFSRRTSAVPEEQSMDHLRHHVVRRGVRAAGQVRDLRQGPKLHQLDREDD